MSSGRNKAATITTALLPRKELPKRTPKKLKKKREKKDRPK